MEFGEEHEKNNGVEPDSVVREPVENREDLKEVSLESQLRDAQCTINSLEMDLNSCEDECKKKDEVIEDLKKKIDMMRETLEKMPTNRQGIRTNYHEDSNNRGPEDGKDCNQFEEMSAQIEDLKRQVEDLKRLLHKEAAKNVELRKQIPATGPRTGVATDDFDNLTRDFESSSLALDKREPPLQQECLNIPRNFDDFAENHWKMQNASITKERDELKEKNTKLTTSCSNSSNYNASLTLQNKQLQEERQGCRNDKEDKNNVTQCKENSKQFKESSTEIGDPAGLIKEISRLKTRCFTLSEHNMNLALQKDELQEELQKYRSKNAKQNEMKQENGDNFVEKRSESEHADGASKDKENEFPKQVVPHELFGFVNPFNCASSCGCSVVFFILWCFDKGFRCCNWKLTVEMIRKFEIVRKDDGSDIGNCASSLKFFASLAVIEKKEIFTAEITAENSIENALKKAREEIKHHPRPVLLALEYKNEKVGHCVAMMPDSFAIIDVQNQRYWKPQKDYPISKIHIVAVKENAPKDWIEKCGLHTCE